MQYVSFEDANGERLLTLPDSETEVLPGIPWGSPGEYFTPAFWKAFAWKQEAFYRPRAFGVTLKEELAACMLCGYGVPSELGVAAFERLRAENLLTGQATAHEIERRLSLPLELAGRRIVYRFYRSKARALAAALEAFDHMELDRCQDPLEARRLLMLLPGVGPKTASYIVRNYYRSNDVAVLDVHITRASKLLKIFPQNADPQRDYLKLEQRFLEFACALGVPASVLDNLMWDGMRTLEPTTRTA